MALDLDAILEAQARGETVDADLIALATIARAGCQILLLFGGSLGHGRIGRFHIMAITKKSANDRGKLQAVGEMSILFGGDGLTPLARLQKTFFVEYGSPDRRVKKFEKIENCRVDVCERFKGANGQPLSNVCVIFAKIENESSIRLHCQGSIPLDGEVKEWIESDGKSIVKNAKGNLSLELHPGDQAKLASLAKAMKDRAASRVPYQFASHGNSAREIAQGLENLKRVLDAVWK